MGVKLNKHRSKLINLREDLERHITAMDEDAEKAQHAEEEDEELPSLLSAKTEVEGALERVSNAIEHLGGE